MTVLLARPGWIHVLYDQARERQTECPPGCYLVRHGKNGPDAIRELERVRQACPSGWRRAPAKENARRLVRRWAAGLV